MSIGKVVTSIVSVVVIFFIHWLALPTSGWGFFSGVLYIVFCTIVIAANLGMWLNREDEPFYGAIRFAGIALGVWVVIFIITSINLAFSNEVYEKSETAIIERIDNKGDDTEEKAKILEDLEIEEESLKLWIISIAFFYLLILSWNRRISAFRNGWNNSTSINKKCFNRRNRKMWIIRILHRSRS